LLLPDPARSAEASGASQAVRSGGMAYGTDCSKLEPAGLLRSQYQASNNLAYASLVYLCRAVY
jgi:hypothetical protein